MMDITSPFTISHIRLTSVGVDNTTMPLTAVVAAHDQVAVTSIYALWRFNTPLAPKQWLIFKAPGNSATRGEGCSVYSCMVYLGVVDWHPSALALQSVGSTTTLVDSEQAPSRYAHHSARLTNLCSCVSLFTNPTSSHHDYFGSAFEAHSYGHLIWNSLLVFGPRQHSLV